MKKTLIVVFVLCFIHNISGKEKNFLNDCWAKQVRNQKIFFSYSEKLNELEHSFQPWQQTNYTGKGVIWCDKIDFAKSDTLMNGKKVYNSKTQFNKSTLLFLDYGDAELFPTTQNMFIEFTYKTARYSPNILLNYFFENKINLDKESDKTYAIYTTKINNTIIKLFIRKSDNLVSKITTLNDDELFGDVLTTIIYGNYLTIDNVYYPKSIIIEKINGKIRDEVTINSASIYIDSPTLLNQPINYTLKSTIETKPEIKTEKYNNNIHFIELKHTNTRVLLVEFGDFLLVNEAPLNSDNGQLIIKEAKKIAPNKPIKYFSFSHYHPHPIGGIRAFIHQGSKIVCCETDLEYVNYIAKAPHSLSPDSLHFQPKLLIYEKIKDSLVISDGKYEMKIYLIGKKSEHTNDFLIYYFPNEKLLFESDLVWIADGGEIKNAGTRQVGLYNAINELRLNVDLIIQSWPIADYGIKTFIPFGDLKKSVTGK